MNLSRVLNCRESAMPPNARNHDFDDERLDCGHYEYLSRAMPTPSGYLICSNCHDAMVNSRRRATAWPELGVFAKNLGRSLAYLNALWRGRTPFTES